MTEEEVARRVGGLWAGLYELAVELGYRWDGVRWVPLGEDGCGVARGAGAGPGCGPGVPVPAPLGSADRAGSGLARSAEAGSSFRQTQCPDDPIADAGGGAPHLQVTSRVARGAGRAP